MAADSLACLLGVMDRLWFHQVILVSEPKNLKTPSPLPFSLPLFTPQSSMNSILEEDTTSLASSSFISPPQEVESSNGEGSETEVEITETLPRLNAISSKSRSNSSTAYGSRNIMRPSRSMTSLPKTMSCKTLSELEEEEVQGFIDLGFRFDKQDMCPRMMSVVPGLQRLGGREKDFEIDKVGDDEVEEKKSSVMVSRPYLSEAWLVRRPDSPLLSLRMPKVSSIDDMKKHLKFWARSVASHIQQES